jgi:5-methylcytosine-specific restriction endonuclease McrA
MSFTDARRGYAHATFKRDRFTCRYCGLDGSQWPEWLTLSWDHLLPKGHPQRDDPAFIVTACGFCNWASNRTVWDVAGKSPEELLAQKRPIVLKVREAYRDFWEREVKPFAERSGFGIQ